MIRRSMDRRRGDVAARIRESTGSIVAMGAVLLAACGGGGTQAAPRQPAVVQLGLENIAIVEMDTVRTGPAISGTLQPQDAATVNAEVAGSVLETYVDRGEHVQRGQLLLRIDDFAERQAFLSAQSAAQSAKLAAENAESDLQRDTRLYRAGAIAERDLEATRRALASAQATSADAQSRLATAKQQLERARVTSPLTGTVSDRPVNAGDVVQPGTPLITVIDPSSMRLEAAVPADQAPDIRLGAPVRFSVSAYPGRIFIGVVQRVNPAVDPTTRQVLIFVSLPNAGSRLVAGLFAEGRVETSSHPALQVPVDAVDQSGVTPIVTRIEHGKAQQVPVQLGVRDDVTDRFEIRSGISAGDTLLLGAAQSVTPGTAVTVIERERAQESGIENQGRE
jgi:RND family efflux transporter MFP subunit